MKCNPKKNVWSRSYCTPRRQWSVYSKLFHDMKSWHCFINRFLKVTLKSNWLTWALWIFSLNATRNCIVSPSNQFIENTNCNRLTGGDDNLLLKWGSFVTEIQAQKPLSQEKWETSSVPATKQETVVALSHGGVTDCSHRSRQINIKHTLAALFKATQDINEWIQSSCQNAVTDKHWLPPCFQLPVKC